MIEAPLPNNAKRCVTSYLQGSFLTYNIKIKTKVEKSQTDVPQGGVLSPMLFNIYMSKLPLTPKDINITSYADDITLTTSHPRLKNYVTITYLNTLHDWLESRKLKSSGEKSSANVFTAWSKEAKFNPHPTINISPMPVKSSQSTRRYLR